LARKKPGLAFSGKCFYFIFSKSFRPEFPAHRPKKKIQQHRMQFISTDHRLKIRPRTRKEHPLDKIGIIWFVLEHETYFKNVGYSANEVTSRTFRSGYTSLSNLDSNHQLFPTYEYETDNEYALYIYGKLKDLQDGRVSTLDVEFGVYDSPNCSREDGTYQFTPKWKGVLQRYYHNMDSYTVVAFDKNTKRYGTSNDKIVYYVESCDSVNIESHDSCALWKNVGDIATTPKRK
jgi:hypothetical protein